MIKITNNMAGLSLHCVLIGQFTDEASRSTKSVVFQKNYLFPNSENIYQLKLILQLFLLNFNFVPTEKNQNNINQRRLDMKYKLTSITTSLKTKLNELSLKSKYRKERLAEIDSSNSRKFQQPCCRFCFLTSGRNLNRA